LPILGFLPYDPQVIQADLTGQSVYDIAPETVAAGKGIWARLQG
jgi:CO dehydrogenase nickel-insertion accessory protein CooC1